MFETQGLKDTCFSIDQVETYLIFNPNQFGSLMIMIE